MHYALELAFPGRRTKPMLPPLIASFLHVFQEKGASHRREAPTELVLFPLYGAIKQQAICKKIA
jgi:hypothetical protein